MLVLARHLNESITVTLPDSMEELEKLKGKSLNIVVSGLQRDQVKLGFQGNRGIEILRDELIDSKERLDYE